MTMIKSKVLTESAWKDVLAKNKTVKDNGLLKALASIKQLGEDDHDDAQGILDQVQKLVGQLRKSKEIAAAPAAGKFLVELTGAAETAARDVAKARAEAEKKSKAEAEAAKKRQHEEDKAGKGEDDEEDGDDPGAMLLGPKLVPLLRQVAKGDTLHALVAKSGKQVVVMLSRKPIPPTRRKLLAEQLGGGSTKYYPGHCKLEAGATTFALKAEVAGMAKLIKAALLEQTGLRLNKIKCRGEDGDDDDGDDDDAPKHAPADEGAGDGGAPPETAAQDPKAATGMTRPFEISAAVGRGGKNLEEDVQAVQAALNRRADAGLKVDGRCGGDTIEAIVAFQRALGQSKPDGRVDPRRGTARALAASGKIGKPPPPPTPMAPPEDLGEPTLQRAPQVWHGTRGILDHNIKELKRAIRQEYSNEHPSLLTDIDQNVQRVDVILEKLDDRLAQTLERAGTSKSAAQRKAEIESAKKILAEYIAFEKSEPLIDHIDKNPFGVDTQVKKVITNSLTHMVKSIS
jgi:peptidoglycan hydrolase-like protein with peptidoglycan-binding domain